MTHGIDKSKYVPMQARGVSKFARVKMSPASYRAAMKAAIAGEMSNLVEQDGGAAGRLLDLYCDTSAALPEGNWRKWNTVCRLSPESAFNPACGKDNPVRKLLSEPIQKRWLEWRGRWERLLDNNPRLQLARHLGALGELHDHMSWPYGLEDLIEDWVTGAVTNYPLDYRHEMVTPDLRAHMAALRDRIGGWLHYSNSMGVVFLPRAEWLIQRQKLQADRENVQRSVEQMKVVLARWQAKGEEPT